MIRFFLLYLFDFLIMFNFYFSAISVKPQKQSGSDGPNTGVVVGVVIGVILLLVIVAVVVGFLLYKR